MSVSKRGSVRANRQTLEAWLSFEREYRHVRGKVFCSRVCILFYVHIYIYIYIGIGETRSTEGRRAVEKQKVEQDKRGEGGSDGLVPTRLEVAQGGGTLRLILHFQWQVRRGSHNATALRARPPAATRPHTCVCIYARTPAHFCTITHPRRTEVDSRRRAASTTCGIPRVHRPRASTTHGRLSGREKERKERGRRKKGEKEEEKEEEAKHQHHPVNDKSRSSAILLVNASSYVSGRMWIIPSSRDVDRFS